MPPTGAAVKVIDTPDGPVDFPATMSDAAITAVLRKQYGGPPPAPAGLTQDERVRWAMALPGTPEGQRTRAAVAAAHGGSRAVEAQLDPLGLTLGERVLPMAPWLLMGAVPASTPLLAALAARAGIAGTIGAAESPPGSRGRGALTGIAEQAVGELASPLVAAGQRVGSRALDRVSDALADRLVRGAKQLVPWWRDLPDGQRGVDALLTDQGRTVLSERYGDALRQAMGTALKGQKIPVPAADATTLALTPRSAVFPNGNVLVDADAAALAAALAGASIAGTHVREAVDALVDVLKTTNPPAAQRVAAVLSGAALTAEKRLFAEGVNLIESLRAMKVLDRGRKRLDPEALVKGFAATFGSTHPQAVWDRWLTLTKAPGARALVQDLKRAAPPTAPQRIGLPFIRVPILHSHAAMGEHVPLTLGVRGIPRTPAEQDVVRRLAPTVGGALSRTALDPALAAAEERPTAPAPVPSTRGPATIAPFNQGLWPSPEELARRDTLIREQVQKMQRENPSLYQRLPLLHQEARPR